MQTFLPYSDFHHSAAVLDYRRLGKQRVEAWQILSTLSGVSKGWKNHPAVLMWKGYEQALALYGLAVCDAWTGLGYVENLKPRFLDYLGQGGPTMPKWLGDDTFHMSHQSNLMRKMPLHYAKYFGNIPNNLPYVWPVTR